MCGIFGWVKFNRDLEEKEIELAERALSLLSHRGPDFQGKWFNNRIYMGHRRLSIIDLNPEANQPFVDTDRKYILSYNGEIYNYIELRKQLQEAGVSFLTASDTEVFLKCFRFWQTDALSNFDGMFAGGLHDVARSKHYLFRDYLGQKPLYYYLDKNELIYASELRSIISLDCFNWRLDADNFLKFLANSYYVWDTTPLEGVKKLLPGCYLEIDTHNGKVIFKRFWDSLPGENGINISFSEATNEFMRLFDHSCEISIRSDVPCGVFLSGGIDSSLVLDSCRKFNPEISAFSVAMGEKDFDESEKARIVSNHLSVKRTKIYPMDLKTVQNSVDTFFSFSDEPHGDPGFVNSYFLAKSCRPEITVALAGDGADELFVGYLPFLALNKEKLFQSIPSYFYPTFKNMAKFLLPGHDTYLNFQSRVLFFLQGFPAHKTARFPLWLSAVSPEELQVLCPWKDAGFFSRQGEKGSIFEESRNVLSVMEGRSRQKTLLYFYQKFFLPEFVCMHTDRASMQNSLEVRSPFLSRPLIQFANSLPDQIKASKGELKSFLRCIMQKRGFPKAIYQQKKEGFTFPIARWLKTVLRNKMDNALSEEKWDTIPINFRYVNYLKNQHFRGKQNNYRILFNLMVFNSWLEKYPQISVNFKQR